MKQTITTEQLNELSEKGKELLWSYYRKKYPISNKEYDNQGFPIIKLSEDQLKRIGLSCEFFSIGQMIEFLDEHGKYPDCFIQDYYGSECDCGGLNCGAEFYSADKLCDSLWEAVKEVLNS